MVVGEGREGWRGGGGGGGGGRGGGGGGGEVPALYTCTFLT